MRLKSYFAESVETALEEARRELGPDALLVYSREAPPEARGRGAYEVVFAVSPPEKAPEGEGAAAEPEAAAEGGSAAETAGPAVAAELRQMRRRIDRLAAALIRSGVSAPPPGSLAEALEAVADELAAVGLDDRLQALMLERLRARAENGAPPEGPALQAALGAWFREELASLMPSGVGAGESGLRAVLLAGPPGAGKTTTLVKLAARYGVEQARRVRILSLAGRRVGAAHELRTYAAILGAACRLLETPVELSAAVAGAEAEDLVLVDTPGYGSRDAEALQELGAVLERETAIEVHLVLPATRKTADLRRLTARFRPLRPRRLILTHLDETESPGSAAAEAIRTGLPVSFLTAGDRIPEDLEEASLEGLVEMIAAGLERRLEELWGCGRPAPAAAGRAAAA